MDITNSNRTALGGIDRSNDQSNTVELLVRVRAGDQTARECLVERCLPPLLRWARGRMPRWVRSTSDTQDVVQDVFLRVLPRLQSFEAHGPGALQAYLRRAVQNRIIDIVRPPNPMVDEIPESYPDPGQSPLAQLVQKQGMERYRAALVTLSPTDQALIVARIERQESYAEVAAAVGKPNANAARVSVTRALGRLVKALTLLSQRQKST